MLRVADDAVWDAELPKLQPNLVTIDSLSRGHPGVDEKATALAEMR
jgi:hypothetical protein